MNFEAAVFFSMGMIILSLFLAFARLTLGPSLPDRVVALDLITMLTVGFIATFIVLTKQTVYLNAIVVLTLVSFLGTVAFARYLEKRILK